jgi:hypothetical protein
MRLPEVWQGMDGRIWEVHFDLEMHTYCVRYLASNEHQFWGGNNLSSFHQYYKHKLDWFEEIDTPNLQQCRCDFYSTILVSGCQCGGT